MIHIASATSNSSGEFLFNNIPATFTHLQLRWFVRSTGTSANGDQLGYYFNGNRQNVYTTHSLYGNGSTATSANELLNASYGVLRGTSMPNANSLANCFAVAIMDFLDYANTSKNKTVRSLWGWDLNGSGQVGLTSTLFTTTDAISSISVNTGAGLVAATGSRADLYGIGVSEQTGA